MILTYKLNCFRQATSIEWRYTEDGRHVRVSVRSGRIIPIPVSSQETIDYKVPQLYQEQAKDTTKADVEKITFAVCKITYILIILKYVEFICISFIYKNLLH